jgi:hypothetical protein
VGTIKTFSVAGSARAEQAVPLAASRSASKTVAAVGEAAEAAEGSLETRCAKGCCRALIGRAPAPLRLREDQMKKASRSQPRMPSALAWRPGANPLAHQAVASIIRRPLTGSRLSAAVLHATLVSFEAPHPRAKPTVPTLPAQAASLRTARRARCAPQTPIMRRSSPRPKLERAQRLAIPACVTSLCSDILLKMP